MEGITYYRLSFYVPESHLANVKQAIFNTGAGRFSHYDNVCWQSIGEGQFRPLEGSNPSIGQCDRLEKVTEFKVELLCSEENIVRAVDALNASHPYEEPADAVVRLEDF